MSASHFLMTREAARRLTERLSRLEAVSQFDQPGELQAATLAHSLTGLSGLLCKADSGHAGSLPSK